MKLKCSSALGLALMAALSCLATPTALRAQDDDGGATLTINNGGDDGSDSGATLTDTGTGTIIVSGANTYTGTTTIDNGTITVSNGSLTGGTLTTVTAPGVTLGTTGTLTGVIGGGTGTTVLVGGTLNFGGTISTGTGPVTLGPVTYTGSLTLTGSNGTTSTNPVGITTLTGSGTLNLTGGAFTGGSFFSGGGTITINNGSTLTVVWGGEDGTSTFTVTDLGGQPETGSITTLLGITPPTDLEATGFVVDNFPAPPAGLGPVTSDVVSPGGPTGGTPSIQPASAVPEPSTWAMLAAGLGLLFFWHRSRRSVET